MPGVPVAPPINRASLLAQAMVKPVTPAAPAIKAEDAEKPKKTKSITLEDVDTDRKAIHAAYDIVEAIYRTVDNIDRATQVVQAIASVHRNERKRLAKK
jgi:hypothetical protein